MVGGGDALETESLMAVTRKQQWRPAPRPEWVARINEEGRCMDIEHIVPLDERSLLDAARNKTGLSDFGEDYWIEPFRVLLKAIEEQAELNLMGRLMARGEILMLLENRLLLAETRKQHPEIAAEQISTPVFIVGLPRSGTSILFEILAQDPRFRVPRYWEGLFPCPPPEAARYDTDPRIARADALVTQWNRVTPEYETMHESRGHLPCECSLLLANCFITEHLGAMQQVPRYNAWVARADHGPVYRFHRQFLQHLQWKNRREGWLLKGPEHLGYLKYLFKEYPDARVIQTHRDPIKSMSSSASLLGTLTWMRSDRPFESEAFDELMLAEATAARLERVMRQRDQGLVPSTQICDVLYKDIVTDPLAVARMAYGFLHIKLTDSAIEKMTAYVASKPQGKFGVHKYHQDQADEVSKERPLFGHYQERYGVPSEV